MRIGMNMLIPDGAASGRKIAITQAALPSRQRRMVISASAHISSSSGSRGATAQAQRSAWPVSMNSRNSKWYLRIAPDETYFEPCSEKAAFQMQFGQIDPEMRLQPLIIRELPFALGPVELHLYRRRSPQHAGALDWFFDTVSAAVSGFPGGFEGIHISS